MTFKKAIFSFLVGTFFTVVEFSILIGISYGLAKAQNPFALAYSVIAFFVLSFALNYLLLFQIFKRDKFRFVYPLLGQLLLLYLLIAALIELNM